ncbi:response regulator [Paenibacillus sp. FSL H3-0333]|uniref:response regulator n=1 Tax=Paenibacillus sp. FSL H3-0333 TaxID=2921373 RepID=UPI0030F4BBAB
MKVILVDDERMMHLILSTMLLKLPEVELAGSFTDTKPAAAFLEEHPDVELAFVDLSMPGEGGMAFAARLAAAGSPVQIVFVTSHKEFALEAYDLSVLDYLVKPVSQERLARTVNRVLTQRRAAPARLSPLPEVQAPAGSGRVRLTMLGDVAVSSGAGRVKWTSRKCAELFAYLLLLRGKRVPRSRLVADIFGGMHKANAESYLNTTVYQLRKSLEPLGLREAIRSENDGYALELQAPVIDYLEFEQEAAALHTIEPPDIERAMRIEQLYTGELFGDKAYVWAIHETERYAELYASFVKRLAAALIASRDSAAASKLLLKLNKRNPLDESVIRQLMAVHELAGDKKGLNAVYTDYVRLLSRELGIKPSGDLIYLYDSLVRRISELK